MTEEALFDLALNAPEAERAALLDRECAGDPILRARVEALLRADITADLTLANSGNRAAGETRSYSPPIGTAGVVVGGKYRLVEPIGEGGMGSVWLAHQTDPVKRKVAVKLIKAGMDSKAVIARFEAERQALAVMDHPNIAKILDGGLHDGRPYFVMELVKGVPITEFCDARKLTPRQRLELFVPVCQAIQHAHQKGIIHRDIKPNNVLVTLYDDKPVPKVIDFGLAKATGGGLTDLSISTGLGSVVGTPQYMSPEQASLTNLDIDTRSDIYSLGVLLYELLAGSPPFKTEELNRAGLMEMLRVVREDAPPKPSTKLSTADALPSLSANRGTEPKKLTALLRVELDWVVMKALEKDRARRYETANGFAADVNRYLSGEAVQAHPPSAAYRLKKFLRKNRRPALAVGVVLAACVVGTVGTGRGFLEARQQRDAAEEARAEESTQRGLAETNAAAANTATASAQASEAVATREKRNAQAVAASSALDQGQQICEGGDVVRGLHVMVKALPAAVESGESAIEDAIRCNIAAWLPCANRIVAHVWGRTVNRACLDPEGKQILTGGDDGELVVRDATTLAQIGRVENAGTFILQVAWQPRGNRIAVLGRDGLLRLWEIGTSITRAKLLRVCAPMNDVPRGALSFSSDGTKLLVGAMGRAAVLVDVVKGEVVSPNFVHGSTHCDAVAISPDGTKAVVATPNWSARVYDITTGQPLSPNIRTYGCNFCTGISPDGTKFFTGHHMDASLQVWDMTTGAAVGTRIAPGGPVLTAAFSPDGRHLAIGGWMAFVRVWDYKTGKAVGSPIPSDANSVTFTSDGHRIMVAAGGVGMWQFPDRDLVWTAERLPGSVHGFAIRPDSGELSITMTNAFTRNSDGSQTAFLRRYKVATGEPIRPFLPTNHGRFATYLRYTPDGRTIYCAQSEGVSEFDLALSREARFLVHPDAKQGYGPMDLSSDGRYLAVSGGGHVAVYDRTLAAWTHRVGYNKVGQTAIEFLSNSHTLVDFSGGKLLAWDIDAVPFVARERYDSGLGYCTSACVRNDGSTVAVMNSVGNLAEHDYATGRPTGLRYGNLMGSHPIYSADGRWLYIADQAGYAARHRATRKRLGPLYTDIDGSGLGVTPDGQHLITVDSERRLQCWRIPSPVKGTPNEVMRLTVQRIGIEERDGQYLAVRPPERPTQTLVVPPPLSVTDYREIHGADLPAVRAWLTALPENLRPTHITVQEGSNGKRFDALAIDDGSGTPFDARLALGPKDRAKYGEDADDPAMWGNGWQRSWCSFYHADGILYRNHVWSRGEPCEMVWGVRGKLAEGLDVFRNRRMRPDGAIEYADNLHLHGGSDGGLAWEFHADLTAAQVAEKLAESRTRKWRPTLVHRHRDDSDKFVLVLVENPKDVPWEYHAGLSVGDYETRMADGRSRGHRPQYVQSWVGQDGAAVYSAVWVGDLKPRQVGVKGNDAADATVDTGSGWLPFALQVLADRCRGLVTPDGVIHWRPLRPLPPELAPVPREKP